MLELYRSRELSAGLAATFLNTEKLAFIRWASERGVPYFDMTPEEWQLELEAIRTSPGKLRRLVGAYLA